MANGYTYKVVDGEITALKDFIAVFSDHSEFLRENQKNLEYYSEQLESAVEDLLDFLDKHQTDEQKIAYGKQRQEEFVQNILDSVENEKRKARNLYEMRIKVENWKVTETIQPLKNRMLRELYAAIEFDCRADGFYDSQVTMLKIERNPFHFYNSQVSALQNNITYHLKELKSALENKAKYEKNQIELQKSLENI